MAWPQDLLTIETQLQLTAGWTTISDDVYARDDGTISITRGRPDEAQTIDPSQLTLELNNRAGAYSPRNPTGAYYGQIGRNTPIRLSVLTGTAHLELPGAVGDYATAPDAAQLHVTGDLDVRVDAALSNWWADGVILTGRYANTGGTTRSWLFAVADGCPYFEWSEDGNPVSGGHAYQVGATTPLTIPPGRRVGLRVTLDVDNGAGGSTVTFYTAATSAGPWTQLGSSIINGATTSLYTAAGTDLRVGDAINTTVLDWVPAHGHVYGVQVYSGIGGTLVANPDWTAQSPGATSFADSTGLTWDLGGNASINNRRTRFAGEVTSWPNRWSSGAQDVYVPITAAGIKRRLGQGAPTLQSTLRRRINSAGDELLAYWPLEDDATSVSAASAVSGGRPITPAGITYAADSTLPGSGPLPTIATGGHLTATIPPAPMFPTGWTVAMMIRLPAVLPPTDTVLMQVQVTGVIPILGPAAASGQLSISTAGVTLTVMDDSGSPIASTTSTAADAAILAGQWCRLSVGSVTGAWTMRWAPAGGTAVQYLTVSIGTSGTPIQVTTGTVPSTLGGMAIGHIGVFATAAASIYYEDADNAFAGETAGARILRLAAEEGIACELIGTPGDTALLGYQTPDTLLATMQAAADADGGLLYEPRDIIGLAYRTRVSLYSQTPTVLPYSALVAPLEPEDDDQRTVNDVTVQRAGGLSARQVLADGALSVQAPPDGVGTYSTSVTLALDSDDQAPQMAAWLLHLGTVDEQRYPTITTYLQRVPTQVTAVSALDIGSRLQVSGTPLGVLPPGALDQLVEGYTETIAQYRWEFALNAGPAAPWSVGALDAPVYGRADTDGSTLASAAGATDTSISVASAGVAWTTDQSQTPWDVLVGGERMTVTALGTNMSTNPLFAVNTSGWTGVASTIAWSAAQLYPGAVGAVLVTPNGTSASGGVQQSPHTSVGSVTPGASYLAFGWVYSPGGWSDLRAVIDWYDSTDTLLSTGLGTATVVAAGVWTFLEQTLTAPASASRGAVRIRHAGTPPSSAVYYAWGIRWVPATSVSTSSPQTMSVIRSVNGVVKAQASGTDVRLADPTIIAL